MISIPQVIVGPVRFLSQLLAYHERSSIHWYLYRVDSVDDGKRGC